MLNLVYMEIKIPIDSSWNCNDKFDYSDSRKNNCCFF